MEGRTLGACKGWLARVVTRVALVSTVCGSAMGRDVKLVIRPQKAPAELGKWSLLPPEGSLIDDDAVPLYEKAARALPSKADGDLVAQWLGMPLSRLPVRRVQEVLRHYAESLKYADLAARCQQSNWPQWKPGMPKLPYAEEYRRLVFAIRLRME